MEALRAAIVGNQAFAMEPPGAKSVLLGESAMENDSIRSSGENTLVTIWIEGKLRNISISRAAVESFLKLPPDRAGTLTDDDCREFVRTHLGVVTAAARNQLLDTDPDAETVVIDGGRDRPRGRRANRRAAAAGDRRKGDRRKVNRPVAIDRRRS